MKVNIMYKSDEIRTGNMPSTRDSDLKFDEKLEPSLTQQQFKEECDVNRIVRSNSFQPVNPLALRFEDVSEVVQYDEALSIVQKAQDSFSDLPADVRFRFQNDPSQMIAFLANPQNAEEAIKLGLMVEVKPDVVEPVKTNPKEPELPLA